MRISDWSSDVCSSDLNRHRARHHRRHRPVPVRRAAGHRNPPAGYALRCAVRTGARGHAGGAAGGVPCPARGGPLGAAAQGQLPRQPAALQALGATRVLALNTVGGITEAFGPRVLACPDQLIDYTWGRISTLCEEEGTEVLHVDFGEPYTPSLRARVLEAARTAGIALVDGGCYGAPQGPRLEPRPEIARLRQNGRAS